MHKTSMRNLNQTLLWKICEIWKKRKRDLALGKYKPYIEEVFFSGNGYNNLMIFLKFVKNFILKLSLWSFQT